MKPNIMELVVEKNSCIGCGVCQAICPIKILPMKFGKFGTYEPHELEGCLDKCNLCTNVCPFTEKNKDVNKNEITISKTIYENEKNINYYDELGYLVETYSSHVLDNKKRIKSASGGIGNFLLKKLIDEDVVDTILTIKPTSEPEQLFRFDIFKTNEDLNNSAGSVYYPTELSEVLEYVKKNDGRYAITVLPCYAKAIRLAQEKNIKLRKRIKIIIGLVCGQMKSKFFTEELSRIALNGKVAHRVNYRIKNSNEPATNYSFKFYAKEDEKEMIWNTYPSKFWTSRMYTPLACNNCTDTFAYTADIVLMDAWLPQFTQDYLGHTLLIVRNNLINDLLKKYSKKEISLEKISTMDVYNSQKGVVRNKKNIAKNEAKRLMKIVVYLKKQIQIISFTNNHKKLKLFVFLLKLTEKIMYKTKWM